MILEQLLHHMWFRIECFIMYTLIVSLSLGAQCFILSSALPVDLLHILRMQTQTIKCNLAATAVSMVVCATRKKKLGVAAQRQPTEQPNWFWSLTEGNLHMLLFLILKQSWRDG